MLHVLAVDSSTPCFSWGDCVSLVSLKGPLIPPFSSTPFELEDEPPQLPSAELR